MRFGSFVTLPAAWPVTPGSALISQFLPATTLYNVALQWLKADRDHRQELEKQGRKSRGARRNEACHFALLQFLFINLVPKLDYTFRFRDLLQKVGDYLWFVFSILI